MKITHKRLTITFGIISIILLMILFYVVCDRKISTPVYEDYTKQQQIALQKAMKNFENEKRPKNDGYKRHVN
ncbi:MAG: hypothetical protein GY760_24735 [Deltaproteobacteria bacterium]|nr:hypothetical protein [Deltaproteobacteria bacterium]